MLFRSLQQRAWPYLVFGPLAIAGVFGIVLGHEFGGRIAALFDGKEKVLSWDSFPWYMRTVSNP